MPQIDPPALSQVVSGVLVLLGGVLGALFIWWLDGRRETRRDRRRLTSATLVVGFELSGIIAMADQWASLPERARAGEPPEALSAGPIELRSTAWERNQDELARQLPRELVMHIGLAYALARILERNAPAAHTRGHLVNDDFLLATRVRDTTQAVLRELQAYEEKHLGVKPPFRPEGPVETRARGEQRVGERSRDDQIQERGRDLVALVARELPKDFDAASRWPAIGVALLSRMTTTLSSVLDLQRQRLEADAATLVRSLYEHAVHFAWLAADPTDDRLNLWRKNDLHARLKADDDSRAHGLEMLRPERRALFEAQLAKIDGPVPLNLADLAIAADKRWGGRIRGMGKHTEALSFSGWYAVLYRGYSAMAHPSEMGLHRVTEELTPGRLRIGLEVPSPDRSGPYGMATFVYGVALYIAAESLGWPDADAVTDIFDRTTLSASEE